MNAQPYSTVVRGIAQARCAFRIIRKRLYQNHVALAFLRAEQDRLPSKEYPRSCTDRGHRARCPEGASKGRASTALLFSEEGSGRKDQRSMFEDAAFWDIAICGNTSKTVCRQAASGAPGSRTLCDLSRH